MKKKPSELLNRSLAWVRTHPNATNMDVPEEFLFQWIFEDEGDEPRPAGFFMTVFAFGHLQHEVLTDNMPPSQPRTMPVDQLYERFGMWQLKLGLAQICRMTDLRIEPLVLFGFPSGEEVKYWPRHTDAKTEAHS